MAKLPESLGGDDRTCYDVLGEFDARIRASILPEHNYYVLGGIPTAALIDPATIMDHQSKTVIPGPKTALTLRRENGSLRDVDVLVSTLLSDYDSSRVRTGITEAIDNSLVVSVFGYDEHYTAPSRKQKALRHTSVLSSRTVDEKGIMRYELFPLTKIVSPESYDPWRLVLPDGGSVQILNPAGHMLAYRVRSISGLRFKDQAKYEAMRLNVEPQFFEEIYDGPFYSWVQFARTIEYIRQGRALLGNVEPGTMSSTIQFAQAKAKLLAFLESKQSLIKIAQGENPIQDVLNLFVRAK